MCVQDERELGTVHQFVTADDNVFGTGCVADVLSMLSCKISSVPSLRAIFTQFTGGSGRVRESASSKNAN
jgi:hypothetical protein